MWEFLTISVKFYCKAACYVQFSAAEAAAAAMTSLRFHVKSCLKKLPDLSKFHFLSLQLVVYNFLNKNKLKNQFLLPIKHEKIQGANFFE